MQEEKKDNPPYLQWDVCGIIEAQVKYLMEEGGMSEAAARKSVDGDDYLYENEWDFVLELLGQKLTEYNDSGMWRAEVRGFGWRKLDGYKVFKADNADKFLREILPETDNTFNIYVFDDEKRIEIQNFHHDAPTGEWYYISQYKEEAEE